MSKNLHAFELRVRINIFNADEAKQWLTNMFSHSKCTYRHTRSVHSNLIGKREVYKAHMHCHHQHKPLTPTKEARPKISKDKLPLLKRVRQKNTSCPITLKLTVIVPSQKVRLKNPKLVSHPTTVTIIFNHNHPINSAHALSFRPIAFDTK